MGPWQGQQRDRKCQKKVSLGKQQAGRTWECRGSAEGKDIEGKLGTGEMTEVCTPLTQPGESSQVSG